MLRCQCFHYCFWRRYENSSFGTLVEGQPQPQWHWAPWVVTWNAMYHPKGPRASVSSSWLYSSCGTNFNLLQNLFLESPVVFRWGFLKEESGAGIHILGNQGNCWFSKLLQRKDFTILGIHYALLWLLSVCRPASLDRAFSFHRLSGSKLSIDFPMIESGYFGDLFYLCVCVCVYMCVYVSATQTHLLLHLFLF